MECYFNKGTWEAHANFPISKEAEECSICFLSKDELATSYEVLGVNQRILDDCRKGQTSKFESHEGFDYVSIRIPKPADPVAWSDHLCLFFQKRFLVICSDNLADIPVVEKLREQLKQELNETGSFTLERAIQIFFDTLTYEDALILESIEEEISRIEEDLITSKTRNYISEIIQLRKKLLTYKRYYDQLSSISSAIEENENGLLTVREVRYFRILTSRVDRLVAGISSLQDYVSQVREAYQTQTDINQNKTMKLFTVITAIFLPLTLIVGWYGMNLDMPEYRWPFGYPLVAALCFVVALLSVVYFKKNKWF